MQNLRRVAVFVIPIIMLGCITVVRSLNCFVCDERDNSACSESSADTAYIPNHYCEVSAWAAEKGAISICNKEVAESRIDGRFTTRDCDYIFPGEKKNSCSIHSGIIRCTCTKNYCNGAMLNRQAPNILLALCAFGSAFAAYLYK